MPFGFDVTNSPAELARRSDVSRPMVLLSSSGTQLICAAREPVYVACLRNYRAVIRHVATTADAVAVVGAGTRGEFRDEDALCCAWIASGLVDCGFEPADAGTRDIIAAWAGRPVEAALGGNSAAYLRATGQARDLDFILSHVDDLDAVFARTNGEIVSAR
jgi:2-phosphosulfolactate phosphatase